MPGTQPGTVSAQDLEPFPPIPGGEDTSLTLTSDKALYTFGQDKTTLTAKLTYVKDGAPLGNRLVIFNVANETFTARTGQDGVAAIVWQPFGVPGPGDPQTQKYFAEAVFFGY